MFSNRHEELSHLEKYLTNCDNEITMILQSLQWDRNSLITEQKMVTCIHNAGHRIPVHKRQEHESQCWLNCQGYSKKDILLPESFDCNANTIVKLSTENIKHIIEDASQNDPNFKKGNGWDGPVPLTLERLQATYTADERRAIHDAVIAAVPTCHDLSDLALLDTNSVKAENERKSRVEILSELRDMKRRRTKYRVAAKTKKYSDVLRDVIKTQMELYTDVQIDKERRTSESNTPLNMNNIKREKNSVERSISNKEHSQSRFSKVDKSRNDRNLERSKSNNSLTTERDRNNDDRKRDREKYTDTRNYDMTRQGNERSYCYDDRTNKKRKDHSSYDTERRDVDSGDRTSRQSKYDGKRDRYHREYDRNEKRDSFRDERPMSSENYRRHNYSHEHRNDRHHTKSRGDSCRRDYDTPTIDEVKIKYEFDGNHGDKYAGSRNRIREDRVYEVRVKRENLE